MLHNDEIREASEKIFSPGQVGLLSGWGVFTTIRVAAGVLFAFERHWARMCADAAAFHVAMPDDPERVRRRLGDLVEANGAREAAMRVVVVRNHGGVWAGAGHAPPSDLVALTAAKKDWGAGAKLTYAPQARHSACVFAGAKILSWAANLTRLEDAHANGFDEVILLNERGEVAECASANIFIAEGSRVWTPPLASGCLPGVTRDVLLSEARVPEFPLGEKAIFPADLERASELFITSTTRGLLPVTAIEGRRTPPPGPAFRALSQAFSACVVRYVDGQRGR